MIRERQREGFATMPPGLAAVKVHGFTPRKLANAEMWLSEALGA